MPYTLTFRRKEDDGCLCTSKGLWSGVQYHNVHVSVDESTNRTNQMDKSFRAVVHNTGENNAASGIKGKVA